MKNLKKQKFDFSFFKKNAWIKVVCLLVAVLMWAYVSFEENPTSTREFHSVPVSIVGIESLESRNLTVLPTELKANIVLSGTRSVLSRVTLSDLKATVDVSDITKVGKQDVVIKVAGYPDALNIESRKLTEGQVLVDNLVKQTLDLNINIVGTLNANMVEESKVVEPAQVTVKGPGTLINTISAWTEEIDVSSIKVSKFEETKNIVIKDADGKIMSSDIFTVYESEALVTIDYVGKKEVNIKTPEIIGSVSDMDILVEKVSPETVTIEGPVEIIDNIKEIEAEPISINVALEQDNYKCNLIVPEGVTLSATKVAVHIKKTPHSAE